MADGWAPTGPAAARPSAVLRPVACVVGAVALAALGGWLGDGLVGLASPPGGPVPRDLLHPVWIGMTAIYVLAMALPFVPGIEIGLALMLLLGADGVVLVYAATQLALSISYLCGRTLPRAQLERLLAALRPRSGPGPRIHPGAAWCERPLRSLADAPVAPWLGRLLRHRWLALALALNLPGNALIGGAGGIALVAGSSRQFGFAGFCLLTAAATSPLPALLLLRSAA